MFRQFFDSGAENSYASKALSTWALAIENQEYPLSTLSGTERVEESVYTLQLFHEGLDRDFQIKTLVTPDDNGTSMRIKEHLLAVPDSIATKYNLSASEEIEHVYNRVVDDRAEEVYQVGGHQALILLGTDNKGFMPKKI